MSIVKDMIDETKGYRLQTRVLNFLSPQVWSRLHRWRNQRANRGWSDRDCWDAGDHIAGLTVEMLQYLISDKGHIDWDMWFKHNIDEHGKGAYTNLQQVIDDIKLYLDYQWTTWADDLHSRPSTKPDHDNPGMFHIEWVYDNGKVATEADVTHRINKHSKEMMRRYKKASKAMAFFGRHFTQFWD